MLFLWCRTVQISNIEAFWSILKICYSFEPPYGNSSKTHFFSYCLSFRRWPAKNNAASGVKNINLLFLYRISISKNFFMMLRQVFWICYKFREPPSVFQETGGVSWFTIICSCNVLRRTGRTSKIHFPDKKYFFGMNL